jgi:hypothetical protein
MALIQLLTISSTWVNVSNIGSLGSQQAEIEAGLANTDFLAWLCLHLYWTMDCRFFQIRQIEFHGFTFSSFRS